LHTKKTEFLGQKVQYNKNQHIIPYIVNTSRLAPLGNVYAK